jgi:iron-sulfur cluster assembly protein
MDIDNNINEKIDQIYQYEDIKVVIDKKSGLYLEDASIDFHSDLNKRGFVVDVKGVKGKCGCQQSFHF